MRSAEQADALEIGAREDRGRRIGQAQQSVSTLVPTFAGPVDPDGRTRLETSGSQSLAPTPFARIGTPAAGATHDQAHGSMPVNLDQMFDGGSGSLVAVRSHARVPGKGTGSVDPDRRGVPVGSADRQIRSTEDAGDDQAVDLTADEIVDQPRFRVSLAREVAIIKARS